MKPLISIFFLAALAAAQNATERTFTIPDFKVTAESLARAQGKNRPIFLYPPALRKGPPIGSIISSPVCLTMHSYNFDKGASPRLVGETNCTPINKNGYLRVQR